MNYLYWLNEIYTNGFKPEFLDIISLISIICGLLVITSKNPIVSVLFLIGLFFSIAGYLITIGLGFMGFSYLLVYIGAVSILFLFILMLINVRISELLNNTKKSIPLAIFSIVSIISVVNLVLPYTIYSYNNIFDNNKLYYATAQLWEINLAEMSNITSIGNIMYTSYSIWLIITSIILLLAMVGAIVITIKPKESFIIK